MLYLPSLAVVFMDSQWLWLWLLVFSCEEKSSLVVLLQREISAEINPGCGLVSCLGAAGRGSLFWFPTRGWGAEPWGLGVRPAAITSDPHVKQFRPVVPFLCFKDPLFQRLFVLILDCKIRTLGDSVLQKKKRIE